MNERILKLFTQACYHGDYEPENVPSEVVEKFAELIVRECARIVPNTDLEDVDGGDSAVLRAASKQIREHFGVEE
jgi:hypothetical protein